MSATSAEELLVSILAPIVSGRVYDTYLPELAPELLYPAITYRVISKPHLKTLAGSTGTYYPRYEITVYSLRSADIRSIAKQIFALEGARSEAGTGVALRWLWGEDESDDLEEPKQSDEQGVRMASLDIILWYNG